MCGAIISLRIQPPLIRSRYYVRIAKSEMQIIKIIFFSADGKHFENRAFQKRHQNDHVISLTEFFSNTKSINCCVFKFLRRRISELQSCKTLQRFAINGTTVSHEKDVKCHLHIILGILRGERITRILTVRFGAVQCHYRSCCLQIINNTLSRRIRSDHL